VLSRAGSPLVGLVSRLPARVHTKLLVPFVGTVILLVVVGVLGLRVLGDSNQRVETLGTLQQRATAYRELQTDTGQLRLLLGLRAGGSDANVYVGAPSQAPNSGSLISIDATIASTLARLGPATDAGSLGFTPPADERVILAQIRSDNQQLADVMTKIVAFDQAKNVKASLQLQHAQAEPLANDLESQAAKLVSVAQARTDSLIAQNRSSFADSQRLFIAVAGSSIALALLLGYVLAWSLIGPIRAMGARLEAIAAGDFSGHVRVLNRDELGTLAANINRMNDELGRLYAELEAASRHKTEFLANMSHELRTPLNAIIGFSQVLQEQMFGELNAKQREYLDDILTSGQHLLNLINDILDLAKVEAGRMDLQPALFALPVTAENAVAMVRERAIRQGIAITTEVDPSFQLIEADERKLKQILYNLLSNAVKFTPRGGRVKLSAALAGEFVEVSVSDTGVGISVEEQGRIFEEFYQVRSGKTQEGTGLGLALTKRLVELHGGELRVVSTPGRGSKFTFTLPIRQHAHAELETAMQAEAIAP
jgi:signal transduction histidine kinase